MVKMIWAVLALVLFIVTQVFLAWHVTTLFCIYSLGLIWLQHKINSLLPHYGSSSFISMVYFQHLILMVFKNFLDSIPLHLIIVLGGGGISLLVKWETIWFHSRLSCQYVQMMFNFYLFHIEAFSKSTKKWHFLLFL